MGVRRQLCSLLAVCALGLAASARADSAPAKPTVIFDPDGGFFMNQLPHGKAFLIEVVGPYDVRAAYLWAADACAGERRGKITTLSTSQREGKRVTTISVEGALKFDTAYCFAIEGGRPPSAGEKKLIERAFLEVLDAQLREPSRSAADRNQIVAGVLGELGRRETTAGGRVADAVAAQIQDYLQDVWSAAASLGHDRTHAKESWAALRAAGAVPARSLREAFGDTPPAEIAAVSAAYAAFSQTSSPGPVVALGESAATLIDHAAELRKQALALAGATTTAKLGLCGMATVIAAATAAERKVDAATAAVAGLRQQVEAAAGPARRPLEDQLRKAEEALAAEAAALARASARKEWCGTIAGLSRDAQELIDKLDGARRAGERFVAARAAALAQLPEKIEGLRVEIKVGAPVASGTHTERARLYISADVGVLMPIFVNGAFDDTGGVSFATYLGFNLYLAAVDKEVSLEEDGGFAKRFSFVLGITLDSISDAANTVEGVFGSKCLVTGIGYRVSDHLRLGTGAVWFRQSVANPTIPDKHIRATPFLSLSVDIDVAGTLSDAFGKVKK